MLAVTAPLRETPHLPRRPSAQTRLIAFNDQMKSAVHPSHLDKLNVNRCNVVRLVRKRAGSDDRLRFAFAERLRSCPTAGRDRTWSEWQQLALSSVDYELCERDVRSGQPV